MNSQRTPQITLYGNLGADPKTHILPERTVTREVYDPITDDVVTREFTDPERQIHTGSLAVNAKIDGEVITRWHPLVDFEEHLTGFHKGDRLKVRGFFRHRTFTKDGEEKTVRELVVTSTQLQPKRVPTPSPEDDTVLEDAPAPEDTAAVPKAGSRRKARNTHSAAPEAPPVDDDIPF